VKKGSFGKKSPTLIHPHSKCGRCVQHKPLSVPLSQNDIEEIYPRVQVQLGMIAISCELRETILSH
jgi:hypothetical protein